MYRNVSKEISIYLPAIKKFDNKNFQIKLFVQFYDWHLDFVIFPLSCWMADNEYNEITRLREINYHLRDSAKTFSFQCCVETRVDNMSIGNCCTIYLGEANNIFKGIYQHTTIDSDKDFSF